jgi:enoyl-CoA hydratase
MSDPTSLQSTHAEGAEAGASPPPWAATDWKSIRVSREDPGIVTVSLAGPGKGNAMGPDFWREMPALFRALDRDDDVRVVLLRGSGSTFSYGLDVPGMMGELGPLLAGDSLASKRTKLMRLIEEMQQACEAVARLRRPVICAVHGWCIGGGLDLASACDVRLASADAKFSLREVRLAMVADIGSLQRLPRIIGDGHLRQLAYTGEDIDAHRAERIGLVNDVYETPEALFEAAGALARRIAEQSPLVTSGIKQVLEYGADKSVADGLRYVATWNAAFLQSNDLTEAIAAFMARRPPKFTGT